MSTSVIQNEMHGTQAGNGGGKSETTYSRYHDFDADSRDHK